MRFMMLVKAKPEYEAGTPPAPEVIAEVGKLAEKMQAAGILLGSGGLLPSNQGRRVSMKAGRRVVTDGPFTETKELIGGFAIVQAESAAAALALANDFLDAHIRAGVQDLDMEIRPMFEVGPCGTTAH
jgi:hypothetical protein